MPHEKLIAAGALVFLVALVEGGSAGMEGPAAAHRGFIADSDSAAVQITPAMIDAGRKIFHGPGGCFACHGPKLGGSAIAPRLSDSVWINGDGSYADIVHIVSNGVAGTLMVSHPGGISDAQLRNVAAYVWAVSHGKAKP